MCTVTFLPTSQNAFILTSNRDEQPGRSSNTLCEKTFQGQQLIYPKDAGAGGTWIVISSSGRAICLLNGAFQNHHRKPPYRRSRGLMALDFFAFDHATAFLKAYQFAGMEPFTMIVWEKGQLMEVRWDEQRLHLSSLNAQEPHIWSSATLYNAEVREMRKNWFREWLSHNNTFSRETAFDFHFNAGNGDPENDVIMNRRNIVRTVSVTSIVQNPSYANILYKDLLAGNQAAYELETQIF